MDVPEDLLYTTDHEWVRVDGTSITLGITDFAQDALGDVVYVELPESGSATSAGAAFAEVESTKSVSDIISPIDGNVTEVNDSLSATPELLNSEPYGAGWICRIESADASQLKNLLTPDAYRTLTEQ